MRAVFVAVCLAALSGSSVASAPILTDGLSPQGSLGVTGLSNVISLRRTIDQLAEDFADTGTYGALVDAAGSLKSAFPTDKGLDALLAAAHAAAGQLDEAKALLDRGGFSAETITETTDDWAAIAQALIARQTGHLEDAETAAARAISLSPDNAYAHNVAGSVAVAAGDMMLAAEHFADAVEKAPQGVPYLANLGAVLVDQMRLAAAEEPLERALNLAPTDCTALIAKGRRLSAIGDQPGAASAFRQCVEVEPRNTVAASGALEAQIAQGKLAEADALVVTFPEAFAEPAILQARIAMLAADPARAAGHMAEAGSSAARHLLSALVLAANGDPAAGSAAAAALAEDDRPALWPIHHGLAVAAGTTPMDDITSNTPQAAFFRGLTAGDGATALQDLLQADRVTPHLRFDGATASDAAALTIPGVRKNVALGMVWELSGFRELARDAYERAEANRPEAALVHLLLGHSLLEVDRLAAERALSRAIDLSPKLWAAHRDLGTLQARKGDFDAALVSFGAAADITRDPDILLLLGATAEAAQDMNAAKAAYEELVQQAPESFVALNQFAWFLVQYTDEVSRALSLARQANELRPGNASILDTLGWVHYRLGEFDASLDALREAYVIDQGERPEIGLRLATVAVEAGRYDEARKVMNELDERNNLGGADAYLQQLRDRLPE